jgi:hypothetical protein
MMRTLVAVSGWKSFNGAVRSLAISGIDSGIDVACRPKHLRDSSAEVKTIADLKLILSSIGFTPPRRTGTHPITTRRKTIAGRRPAKLTGGAGA